MSTDTRTTEPAALWKRLFATLYDTLILVAISLLYGALVTLVSTTLLGNTADNYKPNAGGLLVQLGWVATIMGFYCFFWLRVGQTVAMKAWRLRLITTSGEPLTLALCIARCTLGCLSLAAFGLGYFWQLFDKDKMALHDRLTGTKIIQLSKQQA